MQSLSFDNEACQYVRLKKMDKERLILLHKHQIDNAKRMWEAESISTECYMENKAIHEQAIKELKT